MLLIWTTSVTLKTRSFWYLFISGVWSNWVVNNRTIGYNLCNLFFIIYSLLYHKNYSHYIREYTIQSYSYPCMNYTHPIGQWLPGPFYLPPDPPPPPNVTNTYLTYFNCTLICWLSPYNLTLLWHLSMINDYKFVQSKRSTSFMM